MKYFLRKYLPHPIKLQIKLLQRFCYEQKTQYSYSKKYSSESIGEYKIEIRQTIKKGDYYKNKIHNLKIVSDKLNNLLINPNEVFSFWKSVGKPTEKNNFRKGRNLKNDNISSDFGGGICQFSSIIYFLALQCGLKIIERYPHSIDIYQEHERFMPLGSDSTVVYGYKDLQIQNTFSFPIQFQCSVNEQELQLKIISTQKIILNEIKFNYSETNGGVWVETLSNDYNFHKNFYIRL